ncbi:MAG: ester cyclase [Spirochaetia bacterium]|nr:ester cyclase [Spirochaetia bacterium]
MNTNENVHMKNKKKYHQMITDMQRCTYEEAEKVLRTNICSDVFFQGPHPINQLNGLDSLLENYYKPFFKSFSRIERRDFILMGGIYNSRNWAASTGFYSAVFTSDWLGIPASNRHVSVRYGEFVNFTSDNKIKEIYLIIDILDLLRQVGLPVTAPSLGLEGAFYSPASQDGILLRQQSQEASRKSLELVENMIFDGLSKYKNDGLQGMGMERFWDPNMMWYGPSGIGTTLGIDGFQKYHQEPFLKAFPDRKGGHNHKARFADGNYVASTGWPSVFATHSGGDFLGIPATNKKITMRVMDFWRRDGEVLLENWVFIDLIDLLLQMGIDVFDRMNQLYFT